MVNKRELLQQLKDDRSLAVKLSLGLSDVTDEKEITFQLPVDPSESFRGRPYDSVYLRKEGVFPSRKGDAPVQHWYRIINGMAGGYLTDQKALGQFLRSGKQLELEV